MANHGQSRACYQFAILGKKAKEGNRLDTQHLSISELLR